MLAFDKGGVEDLKHGQKKSLRKLALEVGVEMSKPLWVKFMIGFILSLLRRDQKDLLRVEERRLKKAAFKEVDKIKFCFYRTDKETLRKKT